MRLRWALRRWPRELFGSISGQEIYSSRQRRALAAKLSRMVALRISAATAGWARHVALAALLATLGPVVPGQSAASEATGQLAQGVGEGQVVDLELVLAVDASSSVSAEEFDLQMRGFAEAFRHPAVAAAIRATGELGIAVAMIQWSDNRRQHLAIDWAHLTTQESTLAFAAGIDATPRYLDGGGTAIGGAIEFSARAIERNAFQGVRRVIDISGDGRANQGAQPSKLRDLAVLQGITINGLAILNEDSSVDSYYLSSVIGGTGAFVMTANNYEDFAVAMLEKLIREIGAVPVAETPSTDPEDRQLVQRAGQEGSSGAPFPPGY